MPKTTLSDGEWQELAPLTDGDVFSVEPENNPIYVTSGSRGTAGYGQPVAAGEHYQGRATRSETLYARAEDGDATVSWRIEGFLGLFQPPTEQNVDITASTASVDTEITAQTATLDTDITSQSVTVEQDQTRRSSEGITEINTDQTATVAHTESQTSTVVADTNEYWELSGFRFEYTGEASSTQNEYEVAVESEAEGVEYAFADFNGVEGDQYYYRSGEWGSDTGTVATSRNTLPDKGVYITDTNGLNVTFTNTSTEDATNTRKIRFVFQKVTA